MASRKSKGPNGERGGRLMKALMCEANRKEDRMCGKQMERRQPSGKGTKRGLSAPQWRCLKWPETPGLFGTSVRSLPAASQPCTGKAGRNGWNFAAGCWVLSGLPQRWVVFGAEPERCPEPWDSPAGMAAGPLLLPARAQGWDLTSRSAFPRLPFCF